MNTVYLDNAATTRVCPEAAQAAAADTLAKVKHAMQIDYFA